MASSAFSAPYRTSNGSTPYRPSGSASQLPLSSAYESGQRGLYGTLQGELGAINARRGQLPYEQNLQLGRYNQDQQRGVGRINQDAGWQYGRTNENMSERGIFNSGLRDQQLGRDSALFQRQRQDLDTSIGRGREDLGMNYSRELSDLGQRESAAYGGYNRGLMDLMLQVAQSQGQDASLPFYARGVA